MLSIRKGVGPVNRYTPPLSSLLKRRLTSCRGFCLSWKSGYYCHYSGCCYSGSEKNNSGYCYLYLEKSSFGYCCSGLVRNSFGCCASYCYSEGCKSVSSGCCSVNNYGYYESWSCCAVYSFLKSCCGWSVAYRYGCSGCYFPGHSSGYCVGWSSADYGYCSNPDRSSG